MRFGGRAGTTGRGRAGISLLILGLLHVPLPEPDYHNVRHHDAPGEVCEHHDHLLRWHPDAGLADDVAVLHWHWLSSASTPADRSAPGDGPALHAHEAGGWDAPAITVGPPSIPGGAERPATGPSATSLAYLAFDAGVMTPARPGRASPRGYAATFTARVSSACLLQRWDC